MATALSFNTAKSDVISILQASRTPYATTVDGSNAQFSSDTEIANAILMADGVVCTTIANTPQSPFQSTFAIAAVTVTNGANLPARNGMVIGVTGVQGAVASSTFAAAAISTTTDLVTAANHGWLTGQKVQVSNAGGSLPTGLTAATDYWLYVASTSTYGFCTNVNNAKAGTLINITSQNTGTNTVTAQYVDFNAADYKDTVVQANDNAYLFSDTNGVNAGIYFIEGNKIYFTGAACKVVVTDYTLTASPQAPEPFLNAVVAGAIAHLLKDGGDSTMITYYRQYYENALMEIKNGATILPPIQAYVRGN